MTKYTCSVCGYVYDEAAGAPDDGIPAGTKWEDVPDDWACPLCGADKDAFEREAVPKPQAVSAAESDVLQDRRMTDALKAVLCANLAKGSQKQYRAREAELWGELSKHFDGKAEAASGATFGNLAGAAAQDLAAWPEANGIAAGNGDRGALRALAWGEKVTKIQGSLLQRLEKQGGALLDDTNVYVCEICGFVYLGSEPPEICPVCKVPKMKIAKVQRR